LYDWVKCAENLTIWMGFDGVPIVRAANLWSSHVIVRSNVMKKFEFCAGNLNLTTLRMDGNFGCVH
jgi:hypothetical protein